MENTVYTYGAGEMLAQVFNAIASLVNSKSGILYNPLVKFSISLGLMWSVVTMIYGDVTGFFKGWMAPMIVALSLVFVPTTRVHINDQVTGYRFTVDNVPWGLGASAGLLSDIGHTVTKRMEMVFSVPDDLKYHKTGSMMASNLIANSKKFQITNLELKETMKSFVNQCVVYDAMLGRKYTFNDLKNSKDIWALISANASPARSFMFKGPARDDVPEIVTCRRGVELLEPLLAQDVENAFQLFDRKFFGNPDGVPNVPARVPGALLKQYLPGAMNYMTDMAKTANDYMMQQMMIHAVVDGIESKSTELGNAHNFAVRKAYLQQRANQETTAGIAGNKVVALKNVMEILVYVAFIFMMPLALLPKGWTAISRWFGLLMWVQLWPPFYAALNLIQTFRGRSESLGLLTDGGGTGMSIANSVGMIDLHADMAAQAGFMSLTVGTLAYALVKGGAASFVHLAGQMSAPASAAAASASDSMMSGNYSFGNVSSGTVAADNNTSGQFNDSPSYSSGAFTQNDGVTSLTTSDDGHVLSVANSNLRSKINLAEATESRYTEQSQEAARVAENKGVQAAQAEADMNKKTIDYATHRAHNTSGGTGASVSDTAGDNTALSDLNNLNEKFSNSTGMSKDKSSQLLAKASAAVSGGFGFEVFGSGLRTNASIEGATQFTDNDVSKEDWNKAKDFVKSENYQTVMSKATQSVLDTKHSDMSDEGKRLAQGVHGSHDKSNQYREEAGKSLQLSKDYSKLAADTRSNSATINEDASQRYVNWLQEQSLPNSSGRMGIQDAQVIVSSRPELDRQYQQRFVEEQTQQMTSHLKSGSGPKSFGDIKEGYDKATVQNKVSKDPMKQVAQEGAKGALGSGFKVPDTAKVQANQNIENIGSKMNAGEASLKSGGDTLTKGIQEKVGNQGVNATSRGGDDLLKLGGGETSGLSSKIKNIEDQMTDQTEAMEKANKMQAFAKNNKLGG
ncbi:MAG: conjugal transfer protein TraG N-terminal domain-containing protein [Alphaproteobacteria bacterium]|nr:conjugal transfer protein TraG N-terminal domain-containing protein [Alphaproteobacteria bacterium]